MRMQRRHLSIILAFILSSSLKVSGLVCLSCQDVPQPRHCHQVEECIEGQYCSVQSSLDEFQDVHYKLGCKTKEYCPNYNTTLHSGPHCTDCCQTNLCNANGCGTPGFPKDTGPICYNCKSLGKGRPCHHIDICDRDETCYAAETEEFGDVLVDNGCMTKHACRITNGQVPSLIVGRRAAATYRSLAHPTCTYCCDDSLCNSNCALARDCLDIHIHNQGAPSGPYNIIVSNKPLAVWCDMVTDGGGWTVFQKRFDGSVNFYQDFSAYQAGFGDIHGEYWLGLENIHQLTMGHNNTLRVDIVAYNGSHQHDTIPLFNVGPGPLYVLNVQDPTGTTASRQITYLNGSSFTTKDVDRDSFSSINCAVLFHGGFWYNACIASANPNGRYNPGSNDHDMSYYNSKGNRAIEMKFRRFT